MIYILSCLFVVFIMAVVRAMVRAIVCVRVHVHVHVCVCVCVLYSVFN